MGLASLTMAAGTKFDFAGVKTDNGRVPDRLVRVGTQVAGDAVDGDRWQVSRRYFPPFRMVSLSDCADDAAALKLAQQMDDTRYLQAKLSITRPAGTSQWAVIVLDVQPEVLPGALFGPGITGTRAVRATWTLQVTAA